MVQLSFLKVEKFVSEPKILYRLYVGNLKPNCSEQSLRSLFALHAVEVESILVKRSYAFVDCVDQANADRGIDKLNGLLCEISDRMQVEPSVGRRRRSNKIQIRNFPNHIGVEELEELVSNYGAVQKCELVGAEGLVYVTFDSPDSAQSAVQSLNDIDFQGSSIKVDFASNKIQRRPRPNNQEGPMPERRDNRQQMGGPRGHPLGQDNRVQELPLRMVVGSEFVGAIIGRAGQTIQNITSQTRARVDVHRADMTMTPETVITIKGSPESCASACVEIMKIVQSESQALVKGKGPQDQLGSDRDHPMKVLCPNNLCGRIIGKGGSVIKGFMEQSGTHIVVSSAQDGTYYADRVVTFTGPLDNCKKGLEMVFEKMRKCAELDQQNFQNNMGPYGGMGPAGPMGPNFYQGNRGGPFPGPSGPYQMGGGMYQGGPGLYGAAPPQQQQQPTLEITYVYIPETTVGAVIGTKGTNIKNIMRLSGARIKILDQAQGEGDQKRERGPRHEEQRKVIVTGTPEAQWKAQFYILEKVKTENMVQLEDVHFKAEIMVPKPMIGRIIGKGGQHVKEMQRVTGAIVKTPDTKGFPDNEEVPVSVLGHFYASQSAQRRIRGLLNQALQGPPMERGQSGPPNHRRAMNGN
ncbi:insulin-like growth factor 2 mRNA-binding protein 3 isoform X2 [Dreissena polymorpha]|uniref:insulin-like growth factor 2 mRNA-binding protein 3 isoform X2 n=1 Tax=Dreissena polymorpha TaxID=45954 RepID=UPI002264D06F|nr:insulin-like growth factor 2 mRNA-binding protein 3 isoform X2 [Dreissena polymorpha]